VLTNFITSTQERAATRRHCKPHRGAEIHDNGEGDSLMVTHTWQHKTSSNGPAPLNWSKTDFYIWAAFISYLRAEFATSSLQGTQLENYLFLTTSGLHCKNVTQRVNNIAACLCPNSDVHFTATIIRKTVATAQRELSRKCNANIESWHLANAMTHLPSTAETYYALHDRTEDAINTYKFIKNQVHTNVEPKSDEPTSTMNANQSNLSLPSCSIPPSFQPPSKSFAKTQNRTLVVYIQAAGRIKYALQIR
jgi:hypothetical protein